MILGVRYAYYPAMYLLPSYTKFLHMGSGTMCNYTTVLTPRVLGKIHIIPDLA